MQVWDVVFDIESNNLLNSSTVDYTKVPYTLKDTFKMHCIVADVVVSGKQYIYAFYDGDTITLDGRKHSATIEGEEYVLENYNPIEYIHKPMNAFQNFVDKLPEGSTVVGHNIINFDLLATKLYFGIDYSVEVDMNINAPLGDDRWNGKHVIFDDTLIRAKTLNPDRFGGQSLDELSQKCGVQKVQFRKHLHESKRFLHFAPDMLYYCIYDVKANRQARNLLNEEQKQFDWNDKWNSAIKLEKAVAELITRQEHRGFYFDKELAMKNLDELDKMMEERRIKIEAILPKKPATKSYLSNFISPEKQFLKNGNPNANITKFVEKHGGSLENTPDGWVAKVLGKEFILPIPQEPIVDAEVPANVGDTTHIKNWLVGLGWKPSEYKEKDITTDTKKNKLSPEKLSAAIERYIEQTITTNFRQDRCDHLLGYRAITEKTSEAVVRNKLKNFFDNRTSQGRGVKVLTNPSFTVGQEKEICPKLLEFAKSHSKYASILDIVEYLTYRHRRNSILGGGLDYDDFDEDDDTQTAKGYLANVREDGRIPTPADTCGAATSRFKHRLVANIPRVTSLYGENMRAMFGVDKDCYQIGYDFDSLEAREEANFCWKYEEDPKEYCQSLLLDKPNDVHTKMSQKITEIIGKAFARGPAKSVKYGATYGAQGAKIAKTIGSDLATGELVFNAFWEAAAPLKKLKDALNLEWNKFDKKRIIGIDGRLVPTRSAHAVLNSKFQSSGVICAKRAMVLHDRKLQAEGLIVDFFKDTLQGREWCQQLIGYHDEAQSEVSKKSVTFKIFSTEEEAKAFKDTQSKIWSDIKPNPKGGFFVAYCRAGELAVESVDQAGKDYGMNVSLTAGYMLGLNWKMCH